MNEKSSVLSLMKVIAIYLILSKQPFFCNGWTTALEQLFKGYLASYLINFLIQFLTKKNLIFLNSLILPTAI